MRPCLDRPDDVLGFGFAQEIMGRSWRQAHAGAASTESLFEAYYDIRITPWLSVAPDVQVLLNPGTTSRRSSSTAVVVGVNVKMSF